VPSGDIDDTEPAHAETKITVDETALIVRSAMNDLIALSFDDRIRDRASFSLVPTRYATHMQNAFD
jgi:hypothetical protein